MSKAQVKALVDLRDGHHCPRKDGAKSHAIKRTCIKKNHGGLCPECGRFADYKRGCHLHHYKGEQLLKQLPEEAEHGSSKKASQKDAENEKRRNNEKQTKAKFGKRPEKNKS